MRNQFSEFYGPNEDERRRIYEQGSVIPDANVLLSLYRISAERRDKVLALLEKVQDRLWVPHQIALEYHRNRLRVVYEQQAVYSAVLTRLRTAEAEAREKLAESRSYKDLKSDVLAAVGASLEELEQQLKAMDGAWGLGITSIYDPDPVRDRLEALLDGRIGQTPTAEAREASIRVGMDRFHAKVPPGYKDSSKPDGEGKAGDYLFWEEVLDHASTSGRPTLVITDDVKEDWFRRESGRTLGPRTELIVEMASRSDHPYHQLTLDSFLAEARDVLGSEIDDATIEEVATQREEADMARRRKRRLQRAGAAATERARIQRLAGIDFDPGREATDPTTPEWYQRLMDSADVSSSAARRAAIEAQLDIADSDWNAILQSAAESTSAAGRAAEEFEANVASQEWHRRLQALDIGQSDGLEPGDGSDTGEDNI